MIDSKMAWKLDRGTAEDSINMEDCYITGGRKPSVLDNVADEF